MGENNQGSIQLLEATTEIFHTSQNEEKFSSLQTLCFIITTFEDSNEFEDFMKKKGKSWSLKIRDGLYEIFSNRVSKEFLNDALFLANWMLMPIHFSGAWAIGKSKFPLLLLQSCRTEICLFLSGYERSSKEIHDNDKDNLPISIKSKEDQLLLINCYKLVEMGILCLVQEDSNGRPPYWSSLPDESILIMQKIFFDIMESIIQFLKRLYPKNTNNTKIFDSFIFATIKLFAVWSAEDPEQFKNDYLELLPLFFSVYPEQSNENYGEFVHIDILLPSLSALDDSEFSKDCANIILPFIIEYLINWKNNHSDITDLLNDIKTIQATMLAINLQPKASEDNNFNQIQDLVQFLIEK